jgi:GT2 family glycosyltransferase
VPAIEAANPQPAVAVAVVSYNTMALLDACLASLRDAHDAGLAEVWVVDNLSTDGSPEMVAERHPWVRLERPERNLGFGTAVNLVARRSGARWIAAANADIRLTPGALDALVAAGDDDLGVGAVAPRLLLPDGSTQPSVQPFPGLADALARVLRLHRVSGAVARRLYLESHWDPDVAADVPWATGAFLLVRREAFLDIGGFDEAIWMYGEDLDLGWRLHQAGWTTRYEPAAVVHHDHSAASSVAFGDGLLDRWVGATYDWLRLRRGRRSARLVAVTQLSDAQARALVTRPFSGRSDAWAGRHERARLDVRKHRIGLRPQPPR